MTDYRLVRLVRRGVVTGVPSIFSYYALLTPWTEKDRQWLCRCFRPWVWVIDDQPKLVSIIMVATVDTRLWCVGLDVYALMIEMASGWGRNWETVLCCIGGISNGRERKEVKLGSFRLREIRFGLISTFNANWYNVFLLDIWALINVY